MQCWRVAAGQLLRHRGWQDEYVVYNDLSGDTHLLDANAWDVLTQLSSGPLGLPELAQCLDPADDAASQSDLQLMLGSLQQLGLIAAQ